MARIKGGLNAKKKAQQSVKAGKGLQRSPFQAV